MSMVQQEILYTTKPLVELIKAKHIDQLSPIASKITPLQKKQSKKMIKPHVVNDNDLG